ncbi:MAG: hypothetical protein ACP5N1_00170 [Candidatus Woesearchaeota archaeon]
MTNETTKNDNVKSKEFDAKKTNDLEKEIRFSWKRVIAQGIKNMKDDVDPVYKGAKMGFYALHGIPTWVRECKDGRLQNDSNNLAALSTLFVGGSSGLGYYLATNESVKANGLMGYAVLGIPLIATGYSYVKEAFRRAKKKEHIRVIKSRIQKKLNAPTEGQWDLSYKDLLQTYSNDAEVLESLNRKENLHGSYHSRDEDLGVEKVAMALYKQLSLKTEEIAETLYAYNSLGKKYELSLGLEVITSNTDKHYNDAYGNKLSQLIWDTVSKNNGSANIEWLGKLTVMYGGKEDKINVEKRYQVIPTEVWKR